MQIALDESGGWQINVRGTTAVDGQSVPERVASGDFPIEVSLDSADGHGSVRDARSTSALSYATNQPGGGGTLWFDGLEGGVLTACFSFDATDSSGSGVSVRDGGARVAE